MTRIISIIFAVIFSFILFAIMNLLIDSDARAYVPDESGPVVINHFKLEDLEPEVKDRTKRKPPKMQEPVQEPKISDAREKPVRNKPIRVASIKPTMNFEGPAESILGTGTLVESVYGGSMQKPPTIRIEPEYPIKARSKGIEGTVTLQFDINHLGETTNIRVIESNPKGYFEKASKKALRKWRYKKQDDEDSVAANNQTVTLSFNMQD